ncbi:hypothetical protein LY11_05268 [Pedobacter cryoconitis]|uniref:Uncharacterized protein n=1 Tax=Pedobacter cryoconitis TaxID=188932 RepID=A0A327S2G5_9SPHI|nr:hypothetical protein LY11_05268 [Pedobacter cryoconitis]
MLQFQDLKGKVKADHFRDVVTNAIIHQSEQLSMINSAERLLKKMKLI